MDMGKDNPVSIRFLNWAIPIKDDDIGRLFFTKLFEKVTNREVEINYSENGKVDIQVESVYGATNIPKISERLRRFSQSNLHGGIKFDNRNMSANQQPNKGGKFNVFFTGENTRPPQGTWDAYLSFDQHSYGGRNIYLPLWWLTSSDILIPTISPYLDKPITLDEMLKPRNSNYNERSKFCVAFIGKAWPFRMHALEALSKIGGVDVFGGIARNANSPKAKSKFETAQNYRFIFAFENDLFPGYVTEKAPEAWATGAIPLYWGSDPQGYLNQKSLINLANFRSLEEFVEHVGEVNKDQVLWESYATQPFLLKKPNLDDAIQTLRQILKPLVSE